MNSVTTSRNLQGLTLNADVDLLLCYFGFSDSLFVYLSTLFELLN
jgi:hypothetical protein